MIYKRNIICRRFSKLKKIQKKKYKAMQIKMQKKNQKVVALTRKKKKIRLENEDDIPIDMSFM